MNRTASCLTALCLAAIPYLSSHAQLPGEQLVAQPSADRIVSFSLSQPGIQRQVEWGADEAWMHEQNLRRCIAFMGKDEVSVVRVSFQPTYPLVNGELQEEQLKDLQERLRLLSFASPDVKLMLNCDHPSVHSTYNSNAEAWAELIKVTLRHFQEAGYEVVSIAPFNEPDFGWNQWLQGSQDSKEALRMYGFAQVAKKLREDSSLDGIRICGGNTLNCDRALPWYEYMSNILDEGNTHQLAGSFNSFTAFYDRLAADGKHATADEMHNVMESMVALEHGLQTGIWWGPAEYTRGEFCKAAHGERLAYAEHRDNWTAASVYRSPEGKVLAFGGTSERQAVSTSYRFLSRDRDVYYNGYGPTREYVMALPGGTGYQTGQTNAEGVVNITWGEDIPLPIDGTYLIANKKDKRYLDAQGGSLKTSTYTSTSTTLTWNVTPLATNSGGDFSYFDIINTSTRTTLDVLNWSLEDQAEVILYASNGNANQKWYIEYVGDNWFRIRNRHSAHCLESYNNTLRQGEYDPDDESQLWRFIAANGQRPRIRDIAPTGAPQAQAQASSIRLQWPKSTATAPTYGILRADTPEGEWELIARGIADTVYVDSKAAPDHTYYYKVKVMDASGNLSAASEAVSCALSKGRDLVAHYCFEGNVCDTTLNLRHAATYALPTFAAGHDEGQSLVLDGTTQFVQLPTSVAGSEELTIATWMYCQSTATWQRIFDFGNGEDEYMFLTPYSGNGTLRFAIKNKGEEMQLNHTPTKSLSNRWAHVAVTLGEAGIALYLDGSLAFSRSDISTRPSDIVPLLNYIGKSQFKSDPLFKGRIDDFRVYNYALTGNEISDLYNGTTGHKDLTGPEQEIRILSSLPADEAITISTPRPARLMLTNTQGITLQQKTSVSGISTLDTHHLPEGIYLLRVEMEGQSLSRKLLISHR